MMIKRRMRLAKVGQTSSHLVYGIFYLFLPQGGQVHGQQMQQIRNGMRIKATASPITQAPINTKNFPDADFNLFPNYVQSLFIASSMKLL